MSPNKRKIPERVIGFTEGIEDEEIAEAFSKLQDILPFKLIRSIPLQGVFNHDLHENSRVLDFGCGSGHFLADTSKKSRRKSIELALYGLDITQTMLSRCEITFKRKKIENVKLMLGDGKKIPIESSFFDVVSTSLSLHHWDDPKEVLKENHRIIKIGGTFVLFDFYRNAPKIWFRFLSFITKRIAPKALRNANEPKGSLLASYTIKEIIDILDNSPWTQDNYDIRKYGPFIRLILIKK